MGERAAENHIKEREDAMREQQAEEEALRMAAAKGQAADIVHHVHDQDRQKLTHDLAKANAAYRLAATEQSDATADKLKAMESEHEVEEHMIKKELEAADTQSQLDALATPGPALQRGTLGPGMVAAAAIASCPALRPSPSQPSPSTARRKYGCVALQ